MEKLLDISEVSDTIGVQINTLYSWIHQKKIPYIKIGRLVKFKPSDIDEWLKENSIHTKKYNPVGN